MLLELMSRGGWLMWPILLGGMAAAILLIERLLYLHRAKIEQEDFLKGIYTVMHRGNRVEAISICNETPGPVAYLVRTALLHATEVKEQLLEEVHRAGQEEIVRLEKNLGGLLTIAQLLPLLGLLGTLTGLAELFISMEQQAPLIHIGDVSGGLWKALLTTILGLCFSIPLFAGYHLLISRIDRVIRQMELASEGVCLFILNEWSHEGEVDE